MTESVMSKINCIKTSMIGKRRNNDKPVVSILRQKRYSDSPVSDLDTVQFILSKECYLLSLSY